jgi:hypothetical protein
LSKIRQAIANLKKISIEQIGLESIRKNESLLSAMNTDQLFAGKTADGGSLPLYSAASVNVFGKRPGPWQLFDTGDFYRGWFVRADKYPVMFGSTDGKTEDIRFKTELKGVNSDEIFGLNAENTKEFAKEYLIKDISAAVRSVLRL